MTGLAIPRVSWNRIPTVTDNVNAVHSKDNTYSDKERKSRIAASYAYV